MRRPMFIPGNRSLKEFLCRAESSLPTRKASRADTVADGENGVEGVVLDSAGAFALNDPETPDRCLRRYLSIAVNVDKVLVDRL